MIRPTDLVRSAFSSLRANPLRSGLTALGVIIGVASVIAMVSIGSGAQAQVRSQIESLGSNLLIVLPGATRGGNFTFGPGSANTLTVDDSEAIAREIDGVAAVAHVQRTAAQIVAEGANWNTRIEGVTPPYLTVRDLEIERGRFFDSREERQARPLVVLGPTVAENLFPNMDPIGQRVRIQGGSFEVIGVLASRGQSAMGQDQDDVVLMPFTTVKRRISGRVGRPGSVSQIAIEASSEEVLQRVEEDVTDLLRQRHRIGPGEEDDFSVQNLAAVADAAQEATETIKQMIAGIAGVSLLVGGIGIMNIMLVSVTERTREIGLRKALGARSGDILAQFTLEAVALSTAGGVVGLLLGILGGWAVTQAINVPFVANADTPLTAILFSAFVGIVFGAYPAWRAAKLDPIEALRRE